MCTARLPTVHASVTTWYQYQWVGGKGALYSEVQCHQMSLAGVAGLGAFLCTGGLYCEIQCIMGNGHMGIPPVNRRHLWKHYLPATLLVGGNNHIDKSLQSVSKLLPAATKLGQGNKFTGVCLSTGGRGVVYLAWSWGGMKFSGGMKFWGVWNFRGGSQNFFWDAPTPPRYSQCAAGTHPTGMHSCLVMPLPTRLPSMF